MVEDPRTLKNELEVAARVAGSLTDRESVQQVERYIREVEDKLLYQRRPPAEVNI